MAMPAFKCACEFFCAGSSDQQISASQGENSILFDEMNDDWWFRVIFHYCDVTSDRNLPKS